MKILCPKQKNDFVLLERFQNQKRFKPVQFIYKNEALAHVITKKIISRGQPRSLDPKSWVLSDISGQTLNIFNFL